MYSSLIVFLLKGIVHGVSNDVMPELTSGKLSQIWTSLDDLGPIRVDICLIWTGETRLEEIYVN